eukprot:CAMPEP_0204369736 /NCGR_PEP_ID=MMETSP0469-20131031/45196_1 /ASSEMBLY_ACC=CAM_ASM_000384 /TAXON_ID=2969 /ORGANISM="Oxyrrhis marina" /LENGTH=615 /DNA_ID=CAMNT_0051359537 /DNA_START=1 /DNA_END=1848 /DNA_ORIENTATION=+
MWVFASAVAALSAPRDLPRFTQQPVSSRPSIVNCTWKYAEQPLDHFGDSPVVFRQRYCLYDRFWKKGTGKAAKTAPIFFYTGNESPVEVYINNTGLMWEVGERQGALLVFAEHRFEPESHPDLQSVENCFGYCTTAQALADYAALIGELKTEFDAGDSPVIAFGGSYGGMLAGWMRIRYPDVIAGSIAASAPVWGLAQTMHQERLDWSARAISRGVSKAGGASEQCLWNIRAAWPLLEQVALSPNGLKLLGEAAKSCAPVPSARQLAEWYQSPWFTMAEGNYPFESTYITYSVGPGKFPLPRWPMQVACQSLDKDFGVKWSGHFDNVTFGLSLGKLEVEVDWQDSKGNGAQLSEAEIRNSGVLDLLGALTDAVGVWYNVTKDQSCYEVASTTATPVLPAPKSAVSGDCPSCPVCDGCPACPVSTCEGVNKCSYHKEVSLTFAWDGVVCNDELLLYNNAVQGAGRDMFWPPTYGRNATVEDVVGPHRTQTGCAASHNAEGLFGAPTVTDPWSDWITQFYRGSNLSSVSNIVWSNGLLDPWSGAGVYPDGGGIDGPAVQNISVDGSQVALLLDMGGHHLDLFFPTDEDPPCAVQARAIEEKMIEQWCLENHARAVLV